MPAPPPPPPPPPALSSAAPASTAAPPPPPPPPPAESSTITTALSPPPPPPAPSLPQPPSHHLPNPSSISTPSSAPSRPRNPPSVAPPVTETPPSAPPRAPPAMPVPAPHAPTDLPPPQHDPPLEDADDDDDDVAAADNKIPASVAAAAAAARPKSPIVHGTYEKADSDDEEIMVKTEFVWADGAEHDVKLSGAWNGWMPVQMYHEGGGMWSVVTPVPAGTHEFKFVVDGEWKHSTRHPTVGEDDETMNNIRVIRGPPKNKQNTARLSEQRNKEAGMTAPKHKKCCVDEWRH